MFLSLAVHESLVLIWLYDTSVARNSSLDRQRQPHIPENDITSFKKWMDFMTDSFYQGLDDCIVMW